MSRQNGLAGHWLILAIGILLLVITVLLGSGCHGDDQASTVPSKLVVIGIDSADWTLLDVMMSAGRLPNLQALRSEATSGRMLSFRPLEKSPILWASICTGVRPEAHGVGGFVEGTDQKPVHGSAWRAPALWDIAGDARLTSCVIGMWTTYPARPINGVMVSDYLPYGSKRERPLAGLVTPDSVLATILPVRATAEAVTRQQLARFLPAEHLGHCLAEYPRQVEDLCSIYAADLTYLNVARELARENDFDLFFFYLRGPDMVSHRFWHFFEPDKSPTELSDDELAYFGQVVPKYYEWVDEVVAEVLSWFPPDRQVVVLSDHGFHGPRQRHGHWQRGTQEHSQWGIFMVRSPNYEPGAWFQRLDLLDICPTILALLNLPASQEMAGHILAEGLTASGRQQVTRLEAERVDSYQHLRPRELGRGEEDAEIDEEIRERLRSLGYID